MRAASVNSRWVGLALRLFVGVAAMSGVYVMMNADEQATLFSLVADPIAAGCGIAMTFIVLMLRALRWRVLFNDIGGRLSLSQLPTIYGASFFLGIVSPGRLGEISRVWYTRNMISSIPASACSVLLDRILDIVPTVLIAAVFLLGVGTLDVSVLSAYILAVTTGAALLLLLLFLYPGRLYRLVERGSHRIVKRFSGSQPQSDSRPFCLSRAAIWKGLLLSALSHLFLLMQAHFFAVAVGASANPLLIYGVVTLAAFVAALPLSIGGLGTREVAVIFALQAVGFSHSEGVGFSILTLCNFLTLLAVSAGLFGLQPMKSTGLAPDRQRDRVRGKGCAPAARLSSETSK